MGSREIFKILKQAAKPENLFYRADNILLPLIRGKTGEGATLHEAREE